jgi:L-fuconolactonase
MQIVDTHVHVWDPDRAEYPWLEGDDSILNQVWSIEQLEAERVEAGITKGVLVQASGNFEDTDLMLETARRTEWIAGVVCWLPLMDPPMTQRILEEKYLKERYFKGVRHQIHDEKDPEWLLEPAVIESLEILAAHNMPYDVVAVLPAHIEAAIEVGKKIPGLRMVFDHLSQPPIATKERSGKWSELMKEASQAKNFFAKISGLGTASGNFKNRTADDVKPYVVFALEHFGVDRCFCGGDWPVSLLANNYTQTWQVYKDILKDLLPGNEQEKVFYSNAVRFYDL